MSLLESAFEPFTVINKSVEDDGYGGQIISWSDGAKIKGAIVFNRSIEAKIAQSMNVNAVYSFTVHKNIVLDYHTVIRRESDRKIFRLTSDSDDYKTPKSAYIDIRQYDAEEWELTNG